MKLALTHPGAVEIHFERNEQDYLTVSMDTDRLAESKI
jgi:hypothetical protein